jgi:hypothetical protein
MNQSLNIEKAIKLLDKRTTTFDEVCKFIYKDIEEYQESRERFYLEQLRDEYQGGEDLTEEVIEDYTNKIAQKIEKDVVRFSIEYAINSIDAVLDAINEKRLKKKTSTTNLLIILTSLKEINEEI